MQGGQLLLAGFKAGHLILQRRMVNAVGDRLDDLRDLLADLREFCLPGVAIGAPFPVQPVRGLAPRHWRELEAEAVRLVETSGRTQREIAEGLGIGLSTLRRWLDRRRVRDLEAPLPERQEDLAAELKPLAAEAAVQAEHRQLACFPVRGRPEPEMGR